MCRLVTVLKTLSCYLFTKISEQLTTEPGKRKPRLLLSYCLHIWESYSWPHNQDRLTQHIPRMNMWLLASQSGLSNCCCLYNIYPVWESDSLPHNQDCLTQLYGNLNPCLTIRIIWFSCCLQYRRIWLRPHNQEYLTQPQPTGESDFAPQSGSSG